MGVTTDNASNNKTFIRSVSNWASEQAILFNAPANHFLCFAHVLNLCVQEVLSIFKENLSKVSVIYENMTL
jgi:hypothetical protein